MKKNYAEMVRNDLRKRHVHCWGATRATLADAVVHTDKMGSGDCTSLWQCHQDPW